MAFTPSAEDFNILNQENRLQHARLKLFNGDGSYLCEIQGDIIDGSISIDNSADIRRTCSLSIYVKDKSYQVDLSSKIWLTRILSVEFGVYNTFSKEIQWYQQGVFAFNEASYTYTASSNLLSLNCLDLMAFLNDNRGGQLPSFSTQVLYDDYDVDYWLYYYLNEGYSQKEAEIMAQEKVNEPPTTLNEIIISTLSQLTFLKDRYIVEPIIDAGTKQLATVPYDLTFAAGSTVYDLLKAIKDLYPGWEMYFDEYGYFIFREQPDYHYETVFIDNDVLKPLVISESLNNNFSEIYNYTEVWGATVETDIFISVDNCFVSTENNCYQLTQPDTLNVEAGTRFGFVPIKPSVYGQSVEIYNTDGTLAISEAPIKMYLNNAELVDIPHNYLRDHESYILDFVRTTDQADNYFLLIGQYQIHGEFEEHNIWVNSEKFSHGVYSCSIPVEHFLKNQVCKQYVAEINGEQTECSYIEDDYRIVNGTKIIFTPVEDSIYGHEMLIYKEDPDSYPGKTQYAQMKLLNIAHLPIRQTELYAGVSYVAQVFNNTLIVLGRERDLESVISCPFSVEKIGRIIRNLSGGDYSGIGTDELANQRAEYENNLTTHFNEYLTLDIVCIPWLDVSTKCTYKPYNSNDSTEGSYVINQTTLYLKSGSMSINMSKLYDNTEDTIIASA